MYYHSKQKFQTQLKLKNVFAKSSSSITNKYFAREKNTVAKSKLSTTSTATLFKRGPKKGLNVNVNLTLNDWYEVCELYRKKLKVKMSMAQFLKSNLTSNLFDSTKS